MLQIAAAPAGRLAYLPPSAADSVILDRRICASAFWPSADNAQPLGGLNSPPNRWRTLDRANGRPWQSRGGGGGATQANGTTWDDTTVPGQRGLLIPAGLRSPMTLHPVGAADDASDIDATTAPLAITPAATGGVTLLAVVAFGQDIFRRVGAVHDFSRALYWGTRGTGSVEFYAGTEPYVPGGAIDTAAAVLEGDGITVGQRCIVWASLDYATGRMTLGVNTAKITTSRVAVRTETPATDWPARLTSHHVGFFGSGSPAANITIWRQMLYATPFETNAPVRSAVITALAAQFGITLD